MSRWPSLIAMLAVLASAVAGVGVHCPAGCQCEGGQELLYECRGLEIRARLRDFIYIDCSGGILDCDAVPELALGGDAPLPSFTLHSCAVPGNLSCVLHKLHATDVQLVMLKSMPTAVTEEMFAGLRAVKTLNLFNAREEHSVPVSVLRELPALRHFRLVGGNVASLEPGQFSGLRLVYFELASSGVETVPADTFAGLEQLTCLNFWGNNVQNMSGDSLRGLDKLEQLSLNTNNLQSLPAGLLQQAPLLRNFSSIRNLLTDLPSELFQGLDKLEEVKMSNDVDLELHPMVFANLPSLKNLELNQCSISKLPVDLLSNSSALLTLSMAQNRLTALPEGLFRDQNALQTLDLRYNKIETIAPEDIFTLKSLRTLRLDHNRLRHLPGQLVSGLRNLQELSISSNKLKSIALDAFQGASSLLTLDLSRNQLTLAGNDQEDYSNLDQVSPFNTLVNLQTLLLSRNQLSYIPNDLKNVPVYLRTLDLSMNNFTILLDSDLRFLSSEITINLSNNNISRVYIFNLLPLEDAQKSTIVILEGNSFDCSCDLYKLVVAARGPRPRGSLPDFRLGDAVCHHPENLKGHVVMDLPLDQLICKDDCIESCNCTVRPSADTLELYCDEIRPIHSKYSVDKVYMKLSRAPQGYINVPDLVNSLDLSGLGLKELMIDDTLPKSLTRLDLRNNNFTELPLWLLRRNLSVMLAGNPVLCDCWNEEEVGDAIAMRDLIVDFEGLICDDGVPLSQVDPRRLCDVVHASIAGAVLTLLGLGAAAAGILLYRYSYEVRVFLYSQKWLRCIAPRQLYDDTKTYDVFISFSHQDEDFVRDELMPNLEPEYKVCVHYRDWIVGDMIPSQITSSVEQSRRTIVVLSKSFLDSQWGMNEFRVAHALAVKERQVKVIVILLEESLNLHSGHEELKVYMLTNTYIKWGDPMFWERLRYALPRRGKPRGSGGSKYKKGGLNVELNSEGQLINAAFKDSV